MTERFTLDVRSFEKFLAAAWVLQYRRDQELLNLRSDEGVASPTRTQTAEPLSQLPRVMETVIYASTNLTDVQGELESPRRSLAEEPVRIESAPVEPDEHSTLAFMPQSFEVELPVTRMSECNPEDSGPKPAFDDRAVLGWIEHRFNRRRTFRVSLPARAIRSVAIATPILAVVIFSVCLLIATRHDRSAQSAAVTLQPSVTQTEAAVNGASPRAAITSQNASLKIRETANPALPPATIVASLQTSHLQVTDAAILAFVSALSPYEIRGLRRRARYGDPSATFALGMAYETGRHVRQSCREAARWVHKAAVAGNPAAQYNLALRYRTGDGVRTNAAQSRKWLRKAARSNPKAKIALNLMASR